MKTAFIYARYSSDQQREESIDAQLRACRGWCFNNSVEILNEYIDEARSATSDKRPGFQAMIQALPGVDYIVVHKFDRFSRDRYDMAYYKRLIKKTGARLVSVLEPLDDSPESIILESLYDGMAEFYSRNLAREVMKGLKENAYRCRHTGGAPLYGYKVNPDKTYRIDPLEADVVRQVFKLYVDGYRYEDIVKAVAPQKTLAKSAINSMLSNERYNGVYVFGRQTRAAKNSHALKPQEEQVRIPGGMPQIIDDNTWAMAWARLHDRRHNAASKVKFPYLFQGKIVCTCGKTMVAWTSTGKGHTYGYYRCPDKCGMPAIRADKFDRAFLQAFSRSVQTDEVTVDRIMAQVKMPPAPATDPYQEELKQIRKEIRGLVEAMKAGAHHQAIIDQLNDLGAKERELEAHRPYEPPAVTSEAVIDFLKRMRALPDAPFEEQRATIRAMVHDIKISQTGQAVVRFGIPVVAGDRNRLYTLFLRMQDVYAH